MYTWNTTIEDTSSMLDFHPYSEGTTSGGWATFFQDFGFFHGSPGLDSLSQDSVHTTSFKGASVTLRFEGTAVYLYGSQNCSYSVTLDSQPATIPFQSSLPEGMLFYQENLTSTTHSISLIANPDAGQQLAFDKAVVTNIGINADATSAVQIDNQPSKQTALHYNGNWTSQSAYNVPSDASPAPFMSTSNPGDTVAMSFKGGVAVSINGMRNWGHWTYNVSLDGVVTVHNASTWWLMGDALLFYQSNLDPDATHTIQLANMGTPNDKLSLNYFTVYTPNGTALDTSPSSGPSSSPSQSTSSQGHSKANVGVIVGPVIAGVALLVALLGLFLWLRRRRQQRPSSSSAAPLIPPETSQSTTTLGGIVAPFPRNERPDLWVKGMEAGQPAPSIMEIRAVPPVVPYQGKRRQADAPASPQPGPETTSNARTLSPSTSSASLRQPSLHTSSNTLPPLPDSSSQRSVPLMSSSGTHHRGNASISASSTARTASPMPQVNVDQIIELIAQRIDHSNRGPFMAGPVDESDVPPPEYYAS